MASGGLAPPSHRPGEQSTGGPGAPRLTLPKTGTPEKCYTSEAKTLNKTKALPAFVLPSSLGTWHTPTMRFLKTGRLALRTAAFDKAGNLAVSGATRVRITRR